MDRFGQARFVERAIHELEPAVAGGGSDGERGVAHAEPGVSAGFEIGGRASEAEHEKIPQAALRSVEIVRVIERSKNLVARDLAVESRDQALKAFGADDRVNFLLFHFFKFTNVGVPGAPLYFRRQL